jgi:hypothetical protein
MSNPVAERVAYAIPQPDGTLMFPWRLTPEEQTDPVYLQVEVMDTLPIIFVPGIMGTNLRMKNGTEKVWRLDTTYIPFVGHQPLGLVWGKKSEGPGRRQELMHPDRTEVDPGGSVPKKLFGSIVQPDQYKERGWGEIGEGSYHDFLLKLEGAFNGHRSLERETGLEAQIAKLMELCSGEDRKCIPQKGGLTSFTPEDFAKLRRWFMPVYACGYNWLDDNAHAAERLQARIEQVIAQNNTKVSRCEQVILVTHSMGGLVSRACQQLDGMQEKIAGIVHGVMPANGAAVAYRRCKMGMTEESYGAGLVIGKSGQEVTAVFAQAPGALQLLPTQRYDRGWLELRDAEGKTVQKTVPEADPYEEIYKRRDRWWALVKEEWLSPKDGQPITWTQYLEFIRVAKKFHTDVTPNTYHPNTFAFYGADNTKSTKSFERIVWQMKRGRAEGTVPTANEVYGMTAQQLQMDGVNPEHIGFSRIEKFDINGQSRVDEISQWELRAHMQDGIGDGTVPSSSGHAPADCPNVREVFRLSGIEHEPAYRESVGAQQVSMYAIAAISLNARVPAGASISTKE